MTWKQCLSRNLWKRAEYVEKTVWSRDSPEEAGGCNEPGGLQWNSTLQSVITCSRSDKGACGRCQGQGWGGRPGCGEEAGAGEVWKVSKHNGPLGPPLPWPQDHRERQRVLAFNTDPAENQSEAAFRLKPEFRTTSVSWCGEELGGEEGERRAGDTESATWQASVQGSAESERQNGGSAGRGRSQRRCWGSNNKLINND